MHSPTLSDDKEIETGIETEVEKEREDMSGQEVDEYDVEMAKTPSGPVTASKKKDDTYTYTDRMRDVLCLLVAVSGIGHILTKFGRAVCSIIFFK